MNSVKTIESLNIIVLNGTTPVVYGVYEDERQLYKAGIFCVHEVCMQIILYNIETILNLVIPTLIVLVISSALLCAEPRKYFMYYIRWVVLT